MDKFKKSNEGQSSGQPPKIEIAHAMGADLQARFFDEMNPEKQKAIAERLFNFLYANNHLDNIDDVANELSRKLRNIPLSSRKTIFGLLAGIVDGNAQDQNYQKYKEILQKTVLDNSEVPSQDDGTQDVDIKPKIDFAHNRTSGNGNEEEPLKPNANFPISGDFKPMGTSITEAIAKFEAEETRKKQNSAGQDKA